MILVYGGGVGDSQALVVRNVIMGSMEWVTHIPLVSKLLIWWAERTDKEKADRQKIAEQILSLFRRNEAQLTNRRLRNHTGDFSKDDLYALVPLIQNFEKSEDLALLNTTQEITELVRHHIIVAIEGYFRDSSGRNFNKKDWMDKRSQIRQNLTIELKKWVKTG